MQIANDNKEGWVRVIKHDRNYTVHPMLSYYSSAKWRDGKGQSAYSRGALIFKFWLRGVVLIRMGHLFEGVNSRIYGKFNLWMVCFARLKVKDSTRCSMQ